MRLADVNVLLYALRSDSPNHEAYRRWLDRLVNGSSLFGVSELVLSGVVRVATHARVFDPPTPPSLALSFCRALLDAPNAVPVRPGPRHFRLFEQLCAATGAVGKFVPDAYLAALAIEAGAEWVTCDRGFARFPGLRWSHPLEGD